MEPHHPITPPSELVQQWANEAMQGWRTNGLYNRDIVDQAAQWGADQELEACCHWLKDVDEVADELRFARRPKPPSLKEQALEGLTRLVSTGEFFSNQMKDLDTIRRALEQL